MQHYLEHFRLLVDQQCVAVVANAHWFRGAGKLHFVVAATVAENSSTIPGKYFIAEQNGSFQLFIQFDKKKTTRHKNISLGV